MHSGGFGPKVAASETGRSLNIPFGTVPIWCRSLADLVQLDPATLRMALCHRMYGAFDFQP